MYKHGIRTGETPTEMPPEQLSNITQVVIGTAPIHMTDDPNSAVNKPILCSSMSEFKSKFGYSDDFNKYTACQSAFASFEIFKIAPIVVINVFDPTKHFEAVEAKEIPVNDNSIIIEDDVIASSLKITSGDSTIEADNYIAEWVDGVFSVHFVEKIEGIVSVEYNRAAPEKVTNADIIGSWNTDTDVRTGAELIKNIFPMIGFVPAVITAPGWSKDNLVGAILEAKCQNINGCYKSMAICDIGADNNRTRAQAIAAKKERTLDKNCIAAFPMVKKDGHIIAYSAYLAALIMYQATEKNGITCQSPSNRELDIDNAVLEDGTPVFYDQLDGNELNAEGIVTIISRNGLFSWGNNTAAYPGTKDPVERWAMTRLSFFWLENDFINSYFSKVDGALSKRMVEDILTDENIKLSSFSKAGYIIGGKIAYNAADNPADELLNGHFKFRSSIAGNIPGEDIENDFEFDIKALENAILGGAA